MAQLTQTTCQDEQRRQIVRQKGLNGIDYLEVDAADWHRLTIYFLGKAPEGLTAVNIHISGGRRIRDIHATHVEICQSGDPELDDCVTVIVNKVGDFSTYTLCLVGVEGFDPRYTCIEFNFRVDCSTDLDCLPDNNCPPILYEQPEIDYLAKDYASFRRLILDRLSLIMPEWHETHVPDIGIALVELLAYTGDYLSYYQDAVATEAYLETARQRISVRRHARLVDYQMHEGCNARAWLCLITSSDVALDPENSYFITRYDDALSPPSVLRQTDIQNILKERYEPFEPLAKDPTQPIQLVAARSEIHFYTWGDKECCLPKGATTATLKQTAAGELHLTEGDILIFEELIGPKTGNTADADPTHRHAIRLTSTVEGIDALYQQPIVEISWREEDALPFSLCLSAIGPAPECRLIENISVARGNVILVDHGWRRTEKPEPRCVPIDATVITCEECGPSDPVQLPGRYRPTLSRSPLTFHEPYPTDKPASHMLTQDLRLTAPWIRLSSVPDPTRESEEPPPDDPSPDDASPEKPSPAKPLPVTRWRPVRDLLSSGPQDDHFVAEVDNDGCPHLRFGDGEMGRRPQAATDFTATYRTGIGPEGNVGAEAIAHLVLREGFISGSIERVWNPLPAQGGTLPEPLAEVKLFAPHTFRSRLERAITADDYATIVMRDFADKVQRAAATLRWMGSWYEVLVAIDARGQETADPVLLQQIAGHLHRYRRMGHDLAVKTAVRVPLDIEMTVCVLPHALRGHIKAILLQLFSNRRLADGRLGFFHPDRLTFGEGIYLSQLVATAQAVSGVESVVVTKLERLGDGPNDELANGVLPLNSLEVAVLDNDPSLPENGRLKLTLRGGR